MQVYTTGMALDNEQVRKAVAVAVQYGSPELQKEVIGLAEKAKSEEGVYVAMTEAIIVRGTRLAAGSVKAGVIKTEQ